MSRKGLLQLIKILTRKKLNCLNSFKNSWRTNSSLLRSGMARWSWVSYVMLWRIYDGVSTKPVGLLLGSQGLNLNAKCWIILMQWQRGHTNMSCTCCNHLAFSAPKWINCVVWPIHTIPLSYGPTTDGLLFLCATAIPHHQVFLEQPLFRLPKSVWRCWLVVCLECVLPRTIFSSQFYNGNRQSHVPNHTYPCCLVELRQELMSNVSFQEAVSCLL